MSNKIELNSTYLEKITTLIKEKESSKLTRIITDIHVADIAEIIGDLSTEHAKYFYNLIANEEESAAVLIELEDDTRRLKWDLRNKYDDNDGDDLDDRIYDIERRLNMR